jgi:hypothetical protein
MFYCPVASEFRCWISLSGCSACSVQQWASIWGRCDLLTLTLKSIWIFRQHNGMQCMYCDLSEMFDCPVASEFHCSISLSGCIAHSVQRFAPISGRCDLPTPIFKDDRQCYRAAGDVLHELWCTRHVRTSYGILIQLLNVFERLQCSQRAAIGTNLRPLWPTNAYIQGW